MSNELLPDPRSLCTLADVIQRVPGYDLGDDQDTDEALAALIIAESRDFMEVTGREITSMGDDDPRIADLTASICQRRQMPIWDATTVTQIELFDFDGITSLGVIDPSLYILEPRVKEDWKPYNRLRFPYRPMSTLLLAPGRTIALTGTWGFPMIPATVTRAVATFVINRYLNDTAATGTAFADAANQAEYNLGSALRVAFDVRQRLMDAPFA